MYLAYRIRSNCTAGASINNGSFDPDGTIVALTQSPPGPYPLGTTPVTLSVTDNQGASDVCTATVTVVDTTKPMLTYCPSNLAFTAPVGATSMVVNYPRDENATASDNCPGVTVTCAASGATTGPVSSGSTFNVGTTTVSCTATDASSNTSLPCSFTVKVYTPQQKVDDLIAQVKELIGKGFLVPKHLDKAICLLNDLLASPGVQNTYGGPAEIHSPSWDGQMSFARSVCSTFMTKLLKLAYGDAFFSSFFPMTSTPNAAKYHDTICSSPAYFMRITTVSEIQAGDIIAIKYFTSASPSNRCSSGSSSDSGSDDSCSSTPDAEGCSGVSGHVMLVADVPSFYPATEPRISGTRQYSVKVIDSAASYHGPTDTRYSSPGGIGLGFFRLYANASSNEIEGYTWSLFQNSEYFTQIDSVKRDLVVGRLLQLPSVPNTCRLLLSSAAALSPAEESQGGLTPGEASSLIAKLQAAIQQLDRGNRTAAINQLNAFINEVQALGRSGRLSSAQADSLIAQTQAIINAL